MHNLYRQRVCIRCGCTFRWCDVLACNLSLSLSLSFCTYEPAIAATWNETSHLSSSACDKNSVCWVHLQAYSLDKVSKKGMWPCCRQTDIAALPCVSKGAHVDSFEGMHLHLNRRGRISKLIIRHCFLPVQYQVVHTIRKRIRFLEALELMVKKVLLEHVVCIRSCVVFCSSVVCYVILWCRLALSCIFLSRGVFYLVCCLVLFFRTVVLCLVLSSPALSCVWWLSCLFFSLIVFTQLLVLNLRPLICQSKQDWYRGGKNDLLESIRFTSWCSNSNAIGNSSTHLAAFQLCSILKAITVPHIEIINHNKVYPGHLTGITSFRLNGNPAACENGNLIAHRQLVPFWRVPCFCWDLG